MYFAANTATSLPAHRAYRDGDRLTDQVSTNWATAMSVVGRSAPSGASPTASGHAEIRLATSMLHG